LSDSGDPVVSKRVGPGRLLGHTNWNTEFVVDQPFRCYRFFFTATSTDPATYPMRGYMIYTDRTSLLNFHIGSSSLPGALGFSYRISVQGCND
jgi:hypothetical protein